MIINNFLGGLGNQLFQIATAFALAQRIGTDFAINYNLGMGFGQGHHPNRYKSNIYSKIHETTKNLFIPYKEPKFQYVPIPEVNNLCLEGYFQSEKYFSDFKNKIKNLLVFPKELKGKINQKIRFSNKKKRESWNSRGRGN